MISCGTAIVDLCLTRLGSLAGVHKQLQMYGDPFANHKTSTTLMKTSIELTNVLVSCLTDHWEPPSGMRTPAVGF